MLQHCYTYAARILLFWRAVALMGWCRGWRGLQHANQAMIQCPVPLVAGMGQLNQRTSAFINGNRPPTEVRGCLQRVEIRHEAIREHRGIKHPSIELHFDSHPESASDRQGRIETNLGRSEEHTSELQSLAYLVCRLLLEKKKT